MVQRMFFTCFVSGPVGNVIITDEVHDFSRGLVGIPPTRLVYPYIYMSTQYTHIYIYVNRCFQDGAHGR